MEAPSREQSVSFVSFYAYMLMLALKHCLCKKFRLVFFIMHIHNGNSNNVKSVRVSVPVSVPMPKYGRVRQRDLQLQNNKILSDCSLCVQRTWIVYRHAFKCKLQLWLEQLFCHFAFGKIKCESVHITPSPFNEHLLMRYQKWNLSRITITTATSIQIKCLLLSQQNKELYSVQYNETHTHMHTNGAVSVR